MNVIVKKHYPVEKLPADLREAVGRVRSVTLTIEAESDAPPARDIDDILRDVRRLRESGAIRPVTPEEAVARIRALRDEWDD